MGEQVIEIIFFKKYAKSYKKIGIQYIRKKTRKNPL